MIEKVSVDFLYMKYSPFILIPALAQAVVRDSALFEISGIQVAEVQKAEDLIAGGTDVNARDAEGGAAQFFCCKISVIEAKHACELG